MRWDLSVSCAAYTRVDRQQCFTRGVELRRDIDVPSLGSADCP